MDHRTSLVHTVLGFEGQIFDVRPSIDLHQSSPGMIPVKRRQFTGLCTVTYQRFSRVHESTWDDRSWHWSAQAGLSFLRYNFHAEVFSLIFRSWNFIFKNILGRSYREIKRFFDLRSSKILKNQVLIIILKSANLGSKWKKIKIQTRRIIGTVWVYLPCFTNPLFYHW